MEKQKNVSPNGGRPDPTYNVSELVNAAVQRLDDLSKMQMECTKEVIGLNKEILNLHVTYGEKLSVAESKRIDAIRAVDVAAVAIASEKANQQATVLANQLTASADTLRNLVATTATTVNEQFRAVTSQLMDKIALLERSQYEGKGKTSGMEKLWGWLVAGILAAITIYTAFNK